MGRADRIITGEMEREQDEIQVLTSLTGIFSQWLDSGGKSQTVNRGKALLNSLSRVLVDRRAQSFTYEGPG